VIVKFKDRKAIQYWERSIRSDGTKHDIDIARDRRSKEWKRKKRASVRDRSEKYDTR
jgi:hypothetical protein